MVKRLIKTLLFERGELYVCVNGRRLLLRSLLTQTSSL